MNMNYQLRDKLLFGQYDEKAYFGGIKRFTCSRETVEKLLRNRFIDPDECQNESPTTKEFLKYLEDVDTVLFNGYAVSPKRDDYRVTLEGFDAEIAADDKEKLCQMITHFRYADEFSIDFNNDTYFIHAWWD